MVTLVNDNLLGIKIPQPGTRVTSFNPTEVFLRHSTILFTHSTKNSAQAKIAKIGTQNCATRATLKHGCTIPQYYRHAGNIGRRRHSLEQNSAQL